MSNQKKKITLSVLSVLVVLAMVVGTTFAWFTDVETADLTFKAGVLDITLTDPDDPESTELTFDNLRPLTLAQFDAELTDEIKNFNTEGFAPEPVYFRAAKISNVGTLPVKLQLSLTAVTPNDTVKNILRTDDGHVEQVANPATVACTNKLAEVIKVFVYELDEATGKWTRVEGVNLNTVTAGTDATTWEPDEMLGAGENRTYVIGGYLPETVGNDYQAKHFHGALFVGAGQLDEGAPYGEPDGGDEPDPDPQDVTIKVIFNDATSGEKVGETTVVAKDNLFPYTVTSAAVSAPNGYHYDPAEQSKESTLAEGVASDVTFTVSEDVVPTDDVTISFYDVINEVRVATTDVQSISETTTFNSTNINLPESYKLYPDSQSKTVTVTNGVASPDAITFNVIKVDATDRVILNTPAGVDNIRDHMAWDFVMENDITLSGTWIPIGLTSGDADIPFTGTLDGAGYAINGLNVSLTSSYAGAGLFCYNKGTIKDLTIIGANIRVGAVAGVLAAQNTGTIENCHVTGTVTTTSYSVVELGTGGQQTNGSFTGGLVGVNAGTVTKSSADVNVSNTYKGNVSGVLGAAGYIGGLTGLNYGGEISESWATGAVNSWYANSSTVYNNHYFVGGFAGANANNGRISECYNTAETVRAYDYVGGFVGYIASGRVQNSYTVHNGLGFATGRASYYGHAVGRNAGTVTALYYSKPSAVGAGTNVASLTNGNALNGFDTSIWSFVNGQYPDLINNPR